MVNLAQNVIDGFRLLLANYVFDHLGAISPIVAKKCVPLWLGVNIFKEEYQRRVV